ncbi:MAG: hypothetical protein ABI443_03560 [Chthoniobacterales bacterium]
MLRLSIVIFCLLIGSGALFGQEEVRSSLTGGTAFHNLVQQVAGPSAGGNHYNFRIGQSDWYLASRFATEYNSNINLSQTNALADIVLRPAIDLRVYWQATQRNYLAAKFSFEYDKYIFNPNYDQFSLGVDPDTIFEFNVFVKDDVKIRFYDRPSTQRNAANDSTLANVQNYSLIQNIIGMAVTWDINKFILQVGVERNDQRSLNSNFGGLNTYGYLEYADLSMKVNPTLFVGMRATVSQTYYLDSVLNSNQNTSLGVYAQGRLSRNTGYRIEGGIQSITFGDTGNAPTSTNAVATNPDGSTNLTANSQGGNFFGPYFTMGIQSRLNRYFTHGFNSTIQAVPGTTSNFVYLYGFEYNLNWRLNRHVNSSLSMFYQYGIQSGDVDAERYQQYGIKLRFDYYIVRNINIYTEFGAIVRASDLDDRSYNQLRAVLGLQYAF